MTTQPIPNTKYPICERAQRMQDILLVSSFGLWAMLLGLSPVLAFHAQADRKPARNQISARNLKKKTRGAS